MHLFLAYLKFLWRSTNQHGVHSPFVFGLVTRCFYDKKRYPAYEHIRQYRRHLYQNHSSIAVKDLGAGSRIFASDERKVSAIAKNAGISSKRARLLNRLVRYLQVEQALELGTSLGIGTAAMATGNQTRVLSVEGCPQTAAVAQKQFREFRLGNIDLKTASFEQVLEEISPGFGQGNDEDRGTRENPSRFDMVYLDGNHQKQATLDYFECLLPAAHNDTVFIFDDIHWSKDMEEAWEEIKKHPRVRVSIDTFQWGLVFFRREQEKEHFVIRV